MWSALPCLPGVGRGGIWLLPGLLPDPTVVTASSQMTSSLALSEPGSVAVSCHSPLSSCCAPSQLLLPGPGRTLRSEPCFTEEAGSPCLVDFPSICLLSPGPLPEARHAKESRQINIGCDIHGQSLISRWHYKIPRGQTSGIIHLQILERAPQFGYTSLSVE